MGNKINPNAYRVWYNAIKNAGSSYISNWSSVRKKNRVNNIKEDHLIRTTIEKLVSIENYTDIVINRSGQKTTILIYTHKPGLIIGKQGVEINKIRNKIKDVLGKEINIETKEIRKAETEPKIIAETIAKELSIKGNYRRIAKRSVALAMKSGCKGILIKIRGRIGGVTIAREEKYKDGSLKRQTISEDVRSYRTQSLASYGTCGVSVTVRIGTRERKMI